MNEPEPLPDDEPLDIGAAAAADADPEAIARGLSALLDEKDKELAAVKDQLLRQRAETENIRKRSERELADMSKYAVTSFARDLVTVLENLQRATESIPQELKDEHKAVANLALGVEMTQQELLTIFERNGIRRIDPMGQKFDHNYHQAVAQIENAQADAGTVVQVLQAGYVIHDRLLRPAMVGVAAGNSAKQVDTQA
jgi:molecular chaperone GrpE